MTVCLPRPFASVSELLLTTALRHNSLSITDTPENESKVNPVSTECEYKGNSESAVYSKMLTCIAASVAHVSRNQTPLVSSRVVELHRGQVARAIVPTDNVQQAVYGTHSCAVKLQHTCSSNWLKTLIQEDTKQAKETCSAQCFPVHEVNLVGLCWSLFFFPSNNHVISKIP